MVLAVVFNLVLLPPRRPVPPLQIHKLPNSHNANADHPRAGHPSPTQRMYHVFGANPVVELLGRDKPKLKRRFS